MNSSNSAQLFLQHYGLVLAVSRRMLRNSDDAADLTQTIFLRLADGDTTFHGGNVEAWLKTITKNAAIDRLRRLARERSYVDRATHYQTSERSAEDAALERMQLDNVRDALETLPQKQRELIWEAFLCERTHDTLASSTGVPLGTIKTRIRSGLHSMRKRLAEHH